MHSHLPKSPARRPEVPKCDPPGSDSARALWDLALVDDVHRVLAIIQNPLYERVKSEHPYVGGCVGVGRNMIPQRFSSRALGADPGAGCSSALTVI